MDNGSHTIRIASADLLDSHLSTRNMTATNKRSGDTFYGEDVERILNEASFRYGKPHVRGVLTNFDTQMHIWTHLFPKYMTE